MTGMSKDTKSRLVNLAAELLRRPNMPCPDDWPWPTPAAGKLWAAAEKAERAANEQCRLWALEIISIAENCEPREEQP